MRIGILHTLAMVGRLAAYRVITYELIDLTTMGGCLFGGLRRLSPAPSHGGACEARFFPHPGVQDSPQPHASREGLAVPFIT